jgi:hypothetical protein
VFNAPEAGRFLIQARKSGFVGGTYGATTRGEPGLPIAVAVGQVVSGVIVKLRRGGVVSGTVLDASGRAAPGISVSAVEQLPPSGGSRYLKALTVTTDDRGAFRLYGLQETRYLIAAVAPGSPGGRMAAPEWTRPMRDRPDTQEIGDEQYSAQRTSRPAGVGRGGQSASEFSFVFYPGVLDPSRAQWITVELGREAPNRTLSLQLVTRAQVMGRIVSASGAEVRNTQIALVPERNTVFTALSPQVNQSVLSPDGKFSFGNLNRGKYIIYARTAPPSGRGAPRTVVDDLYASAEVLIGDEGFLALDPIPMRGGAKVTGVVKFETVGKPAPAALRTAVRLISSTGVDVPTVYSDESGAFTLSGVPPGRYTIDAMVPTGSPQIQQFFWLKSLTRDGHEMLDAPFELTSREDVGSFVLTFSDRRTELSGRVLGASGSGNSDHFVLVFPKASERWVNQSRFLRRPIRTASDGTFRIVGLPEGEYYLAVLSTVSEEWHSDAFLEAAIPSSIAVKLVDGEKKVQDVRIAGR